MNKHKVAGESRTRKPSNWLGHLILCRKRNLGFAACAVYANHGVILAALNPFMRDGGLHLDLLLCVNLCGGQTTRANGEP